MHEILKVLRENTHQPRIIYSAQLSLKSEGERCVRHTQIENMFPVNLTWKKFFKKFCREEKNNVDKKLGPT